MLAATSLKILKYKADWPVSIFYNNQNLQLLVLSE